MMTEWNLDTRRIGRRVIVYPRTDSTNTRAQEHVGATDADGLAFLADEQLAGRGQHGRCWLAPPKSSVLLSVLLYPPEAIDRPVLLTAWAAVSVCEVVGRLTGIAPRIKWPNDVQLDGRKVCGILIEQSRQGGRTATVAGIGLNVRQSQADFDAAGLPEATSLAAMGATNQDSHDVARQLLVVLDELYDRLCRGERAVIEQAWQAHLGLVGQSVRLECVDRTLEGRLERCSFAGVVLQTSAGLLAVSPESVRHVQPR